MLIQARKDANLTQAEVAACLGRPQSYVSKYECGERRLDLIEFLEIADVLNLNLRTFIQDLRSTKSE
jgi:transcriptional regulator with XRE-family HTH domain